MPILYIDDNPPGEWSVGFWGFLYPEDETFGKTVSFHLELLKWTLIVGYSWRKNV